MNYAKLSLRLLVGAILLCIAFCAGLRGDSLGTDTENYTTIYYNLDLLPAVNFEFLFSLFLRIFYDLNLPVDYFFAFICLLIFIFIRLLSQNIAYFLDRNSADRFFLLMMIFMFASPFFLGAQVNIIRQGVASFAVILFYVLVLNKAKLWYLVTVLVIALGFHRTSAIYLALVPLVYCSYPFVLLTVLLLACLYVTGLAEQLMALISQITSLDLYDRLLEYQVKSNYKAGIRLDFVVFTLGSGLFFHVLTQFFLAAPCKKKFLRLLKIYWLLVLPFFLLGFAAYSDRFLFAGWIYLSILGAVAAELILKNMNGSIYPIFILFFYASVYYLYRLHAFT